MHSEDMKTTTYACDIPGCGKLHTANNGFYLLRRRGKWIIIGAWSTEEDLEEFEHYCGVTCLFRRISQLSGKDLPQ